MGVAVARFMVTFVFSVIFVIGSEGDVDRREKAEHHHLNDRYQGAEDHDRDRHNKHHEPEEDAEEKVVDRDVEHQTEAERHGANDPHREKLKDQEERREENHWAAEVFQVPANAVLFDAVIVVSEANHDAARERYVEVARRRQKAGDHAEHVRKKNEERRRADDREIFLGALWAHHVFHHSVECADDDFEDGANGELFVRDDRVLVIENLGARCEREKGDYENHEDARDHVLGVVLADRLALQRVAKIRHVLPKCGEHGDEVAEERGMLGHGSRDASYQIPKQLS